MKKLIFFLLATTLLIANTFAQGGPYNRFKLTTNFYPGTYMLINDTSGTTAANSRIGVDSSAVIIIRDTTRGVLLPRMTGAQANNIADKSHNLLVVITDSVNSPLCMWDTLNSKWNCFATSTALNIDSFIAYNGLVKIGDTVAIGGTLLTETEVITKGILSFYTDSIINNSDTSSGFLISTIDASSTGKLFLTQIADVNTFAKIAMQTNNINASVNTATSDTVSKLLLDDANAAVKYTTLQNLAYVAGAFNFGGQPFTELSIFCNSVNRDIGQVTMNLEDIKLYLTDTSSEVPLSPIIVAPNSIGLYSRLSTFDFSGLPFQTSVVLDSVLKFAFDSTANAQITHSYWDDTIRVNATKTVKDSSNYYYLGNQTIVGNDSVTIYATSPDPGTINYCIDCTGNGVTGRFVGYFGAAWRRFLFD